MKRASVIKGLVMLAVFAGVASISQEARSKANVGFGITVGTPGYGYYGYPYYGYGYGNCSYVAADGTVYYRPCGYGYAPAAIGFGIGTGWGWGRGYRRGYHRGYRHRGHRGGHRGGGRRR